MDSSNLPKQWYMLGIGGAGMCALAEHLHQTGNHVEGYDRQESEASQRLEALGIQVDYKDHFAFPAHDPWGLVYSPAVPVSHPVFEDAKKKSIPVYKRAELLGMLAEGKRVIAVAGTHGKTTVTSMLAHALHQSGVSVTAFIGGRSLNFDSNYVHGASDWWIIEADEYDRSFLKLKPEIAIITSVDADHLDVYGTVEELQYAFHQFSNQVVAGGIVLTSPEVSKWLKSEGEKETKVLTFDSESNFSVLNRTTQGMKQSFEFRYGSHKSLTFTLNYPGIHNLKNMGFALGATFDVLEKNCQIIHVEKLQDAINTYLGVARRWQVISETKQRLVVLDYAHHPEEIKAVIETARYIYPERELVVVFQPHLYSRTAQLADGFAEALSSADRIYLTHIYAAREKPVLGVTCEIIFAQLPPNKPKALLNLNEVNAAIVRDVTGPATLLILGAGDIDQIAHYWEEKPLP